MPRGKAAAAPAAKKPRAVKGHKLAERFPIGEILRDNFKKEWKLGDVIGQGGFGLIYLASPADSSASSVQAEYVVKIEPIGNGPLFCEVHFYQRVAKSEMVTDWMKSKKLKYLGIPMFIASGQHMYQGVNYRFLVMQRFSTDLQKIFVDAGKQFSRQTVFALGLRLIDALEYLHASNYTHADLKASNCLLGYKNGKTDTDTVYLVDFGLATKYTLDGNHKVYKEDPRKAHDGTIEFTSIDAHNGVDTSRRADLEILGYCLLQWLCGRLPWEDKLADKNYVRESKIRYMGNIPSLMKKCFPEGDAPDELVKYLTMVKALKYEDTPNYNKMRDVFTKGLTKLGVKDTWKLNLPLGGAKPAASPKKAVKRKMADSPLPKSPLKQKMASKTKEKNTMPSGSRVVSPVAKTKPVLAKARTKTTTPKAKAQTTTPKGTPKARTKASTSTARAKASAIVIGDSSPEISPVKRHLANGDGPSNPVKKRQIDSSDTKGPQMKKRRIRRKDVQLVEMAVQTSPGLKLNR